MNKAFGAGGSTLLAGAVAKIIIHIVNAKWPGSVDPSLADSIDTICVAGFAFAGAYLVPHSNG